jgi:hypothetical protein
MIAPNRLDLSRAGTAVTFHAHGHSGGLVTIRIYDAAGTYYGRVTMALDAAGVGRLDYPAPGMSGPTPGFGAWWALAEGGGVNDRRIFFVTGR